MTRRDHPDGHLDGDGGRRGLRRAAWVLLFAVAGLAIGVAVASALFGSRPVGQAVVLVPPLPGNAFSVRAGDTLVDLKTEAQLPLSDQVLSRVEAPGQVVDRTVLRRRISVRLVKNAEVLVISYRGLTSASAEDMANRVAEATLDVRAERAAAAFAARADVLEVALTTAEEGLAAESKAGDDPDAVAILGQRIVSLRSELRAATGGGPSPGAVLATSAPSQPSARTMRLAVIGSAVLLAVAAGYWFGGRVRRGPRWIRPRRLRESLSTNRHLPGLAAAAADREVRSERAW